MSGNATESTPTAFPWSPQCGTPTERAAPKARRQRPEPESDESFSVTLEIATEIATTAERGYAGSERLAESCRLNQRKQP